MQIIETNLKFNSNHSNRSGKPAGIVLHHASGHGSVQDVHNWHINNGWAGIGYHFYVRQDGTVYRGRPENWTGAHTEGHNNTIGICAEGNFEKEKMCAVQKAAIIDLLAYLHGKYGSLKVSKHKDYAATDCPGKYFPFSEIVNGKKDGGEVKAEAKPAASNGCAVSLSVLKNGSNGEQVKTLQRVLVGIGYDLGKYGILKNGVDGDFGPTTEKAVRTFQKLHNLTVDGIVGVATWAKLLKG